MYFTKMVDMAKSPDVVKQDYTAMTIGETPPKVPVYPWGLCIRLEDDSLQKLQIEEMPEVGDMIHLVAMAKVTSVTQNEVEDAKTGEKSKRTCIELQIVQLGCEDEDQEGAAVEAAEEHTQARRSRFYGGDQSA